MTARQQTETVPCSNSYNTKGQAVAFANPGLIVKNSYWRWPERNLAGNAIDFHVQMLGQSFHDAMRQIIGP